MSVLDFLGSLFEKESDSNLPLQVNEDLSVYVEERRPPNLSCGITAGYGDDGMEDDSV